MEQNNLVTRLHAVINTLNATMLRADQVEAMQRIALCSRELLNIIKELETKDETKEG